MNAQAMRWIDTGLVFTSSSRHAGRAAATSTAASTAASPRPVCPRSPVHGTRKTCGSLLAALDVHPRVAMQILRHSKIAITMEIYTEVPSAATREALQQAGAVAGRDGHLTHCCTLLLHQDQ